MGKTVNSFMLGQASVIECAKIGNLRSTQGPGQRECFQFYRDTDAQKLLWCDLVGPMDCEERALMLTRIGDALAFG